MRSRGRGWPPTTRVGCFPKLLRINLVKETTQGNCQKFIRVLELTKIKLTIKENKWGKKANNTVEA